MDNENKPAQEGKNLEDLTPGEESRLAEKYAHKLLRTLRIRLADKPGKLGEVAKVIGDFGGLIGDIHKISIDSHSIVRNVTINVDNTAHLQQIVEQLNQLSGITVEKVVNDVLALHEGGKLETRSKTKIRTLLDLQMIYTPGVASVSRIIHNHPETFRRYTWVGNTVAIISDGSAILGLGNLGPRAVLPVLEGKAVILDQLAGVGCVPLLVKGGSCDSIISAIESIAESFGVIMIEDISAPACFEIETRLREKLPIPVFHDDQHGTAVVVLAGLTNACRKAGVNLNDMRIVISGTGAAGVAICRLLLSAGVKDIVCCDRGGIIFKGRDKNMNPVKEDIAQLTNQNRVTGSLADAFSGREIFIGVSSAGLVTGQMIKQMAEPRIVFALANPVPEIFPAQALAAGASAAFDGRTVNNALAFPGIIRGTLDSGTKSITEKMKLAAAKAIADSAPGGMLLPTILDKSVHQAVAKAVHQAVAKSVEREAS